MMNNTGNHLTEIVFIIDKSGSMAGLESDTVGGFNATVERQRKKDGEAYVSTVLFSTESQVLHDRLPIAQIGAMTEEEYCVGGCTALLDAVGDAMKHIGNIHKYARREDVPEHTVFVIITDGMENASSRYTSTEIKNAIRKRTEENGWEFIFLAANIDAVETAARIGIRRERAANYRPDGEGMKITYEAMDAAISTVREGGDLDLCSWRKRVDSDYRTGERRKKK